ncbi:MAG: lysine-2,3-aminomutase-like protein [Alphaproteobacteria bacterium]
MKTLPQQDVVPNRANARPLTHIHDLVETGLVAPQQAEALEKVAAIYDVRLPHFLADQIKQQGIDGSLAKQYLPQVAELYTTPQENADPIGDEVHSPVKGIVHRHPDRVLFKPVHQCAVYCRFCFRRAMVGNGGEVLNDAEMEAALHYIATTPTIWEVILTGGDPLVMSVRRLEKLVQRLIAIPHVKILRFHTRLPVVEPLKITADLVRVLALHPSSWLALHVNHADELQAPQVIEAIKALRMAGIQLIGQSVLLKGVNNNVAALENLFRRLVELGIKPYYLHHPDLAPGTSHFRLSIEEGQELMRTLRATVSGLCLPTYMLDIPGGAGKVPVDYCYYSPQTTIVQDVKGSEHSYSKNA